MIGIQYGSCFRRKGCEEILGDIRENSNGTLMKVIKYRNCDDFDVKFLDEFGDIKEHVIGTAFRNGNVKNLYDRTVYGVGYIGKGKYKPSLNKENTQEYNLWKNMLERCYCEKRRYRARTYFDCVVSDEWHNFQNFAQWFHENYYEYKGGRMHVDKDILNPQNRTYCKEMCLLVPQPINELFHQRRKNNGLPTGIRLTETGKYTASCCGNNLGTFDNLLEAYDVYAREKERTIKACADEFRSIIPDKVYNALYNYKVELCNDKNYRVA